MNGAPAPAFKMADPAAQREAEALHDDCRKNNFGRFPTRPDISSYLGTEDRKKRLVQHLVP